VKFRFATVALCLLGSTLLTRASAEGVAPAVPMAGEQQTESILPMELFGGRPVVSVTIDGKGPFKFILDTGADVTVLDQGLAEELHLAVIGHKNLGSPAGPTPQDSKLIQVARLSVGSAELLNPECASDDIVGMFRMPDPPRGVLSATIFSGYVLTIDYAKSQLRLRAGSLPAADNSTVFDYELFQELPAVFIKVANQAVRVHIDTGSPGGFTLPQKYMETLPLASKPEEIGRARLVSGELKVWGAKLNGSVTLGKFSFENPEVEFLESVPVGNLGYRFLKAYAVSIDSKNKRIQFSQP
jgi:hypothetical protein